VYKIVQEEQNSSSPGKGRGVDDQMHEREDASLDQPGDQDKSRGPGTGAKSSKPTLIRTRAHRHVQRPEIGRAKGKEVVEGLDNNETGGLGAWKGRTGQGEQNDSEEPSPGSDERNAHEGTLGSCRISGVNSRNLR